MTDDLTPAALRGLRTEHVGRPLHVRPRCTSTNDLALDALAAGAPHGTTFVADEQTRGRGQRGRAWHSPPGLALHASVVLRGDRPLATPTLLVAAVGLGLAEGIEAATGLDLDLKWPNDLWSAGRKLGGILVEARGFDVQAPAFVAGFGVKLNQSADDFPPELRDMATSLALRTGRRHERALVLRAALEALEPRVDQALSGQAPPEFHEAYRRRSPLIGQRVALLDGDQRVEGVVIDLSATEGLLLRTDSGAHHHVLAEHAREVRPL